MADAAAAQAAEIAEIVSALHQACVPPASAPRRTR